MDLLLTSQEAIHRYGSPLDNTREWEMKNMIMFDLDDLLTEVNKVIPQRIYVHKHFGPVVNLWLKTLLSTGLLMEIKTWDGCFNIRKKRGLGTLSLHSFGLAIDINAAHNPMGLSREQAEEKGLIPFTDRFIDVSRQFVDCGADWKGRSDRMHFQMKSNVPPVKPC